MRPVDRMVGPEKGKTGVGIEQDQALKALVVVDGERQHRQDHQQARDQGRENQPRRDAPAIGHPDPEEDHRDEQHEQLAQQDRYAQGCAKRQAVQQDLAVHPDVAGLERITQQNRCSTTTPGSP